MKHPPKPPRHSLRDLGPIIRRQPAVFAVYLVLRLIVIGTLVSSIIRQEYESAFICLLVLVLFMLPFFIQQNFGIELPSTLEIIILLFIYAAEILGEILKGGADKVLEAGAVLAGGHTIQDDTPKYGLSVTGFVHPAKFWKNYGAQTGDKLILTKPLGTGIVNTAIKADLVSEEAREAALRSMKTLNKYAAEILKKYTIHACTDVTGFGLGGHGTEMAEGSQKTLVIDTRSLPILPDVEEYASMGLIPGGAYRNREFAGKAGYESSAELWREDLVFDPQTSGGLLAAVPAEEAEKLLAELKGLDLLCAVIGEVIDRKDYALLIR